MIAISALLLAFPAPAVDLALMRSAQVSTSAALVAFAPGARWQPRRATPAMLQLAALPRQLLAQLQPDTPRSGVDVLAHQLKRGGEERIDALLVALERRLLSDGHDVVRLTPSAREQLLAGLHVAPAADVLDALESLPAIAELDVRRRTRMEVLGAVATERAFEELFALADGLEQAELEGQTGRQWVDAVACALSRSGVGFELMRKRARKAATPVKRAFVQAVGTTRDPRGLALLGDLLLRREDCAREVLAAVRGVGRSDDASENDRVAQLARNYLDRWDPGTCQEAALALAALEDFEAIPALIELLDEDDATLRGVAGRALRALTGLALPDALEPWQAWAYTEERWAGTELDRALELLASDAPAEVLAGLRGIRGHRTLRRELEDALGGLLEHPDAGVRAQGRVALTELGGAGAAHR